MDPLQLLQAVNAFYEQAFSRLVTLTLAILGFGGVLLPFLWQVIQYRTLKSEKEAIETDIAAQNRNSTAELRSELKSRFDSEMVHIREYMKAELEQTNARLAEQISGMQGGLHFAQAISCLLDQDYAQAAYLFARAAQLSLLGKDEPNCRRALENLVDECIPHLSRRSLEEVPALDGELDELVRSLTAENQDGRYSDTMEAIAAGQARVKAAPKVARARARK